MRHADMASPCFQADADATSPTMSPRSCLADTVDAIKQVARHHDDLRIGVVGTTSDARDDYFRKIVPLGSDYGDISRALDALTANTTTTRNLAEALSWVSRDYFRKSTRENWVDDDGDGYDGDWSESPFDYACATVHVIVLASGRPVNDDNPRNRNSMRWPPNNVQCDWPNDGKGDECYYDGVTYDLYLRDHSTALAGTQNVRVSTVGLGLAPTGVDYLADKLFANAAAVQGGEGIYTNALDKEQAIAAVLDILGEVTSGVYSRSSPILANGGESLVSAWYELTGANPLAMGRLRAYDIDLDPGSATWGELLYNGTDDWDDSDGAAWDAGWLLYERPASAGESNDDDRDGVGARDIYFYDATVAAWMPSDAEEHRLSFDADFVAAVEAAGMVGEFLDDTTGTDGRAIYPEYNLDNSADGVVDARDLQTLVDFTRGVADTEFKYLAAERGAWKLGDSPYSQPVAVTADMAASASLSHRHFVQLLQAQAVPDIVLLSANDGMLHAFRLEDDDTTRGEDEAGAELWAWIPSVLLRRERATAWEGGLVDALWYGRSFLVDGTPVVQDVWLDNNGNGQKDCEGDLDSCEWRRIVLAQQGFGVRDTSDEDAPVDRWLAMWGGGRPADFSDGATDYFSSSEASLYVWAVGDDAFVGGPKEVAYADIGDEIGAAHPDASRLAALDTDGDGRSEYSYLSAPPAVMDLDGDGDADVAYIAVTLAYDPEKGTSSTGSAGQSFVYKAILDGSNPSKLTWCEFYDPLDGAVNADESDGTAIAYGSRPEIYYGLTTAWLGDGALGVYWGTGSPFQTQASSTPGAFFFLRDPNPELCGSAQALTCGSENGGFYTLRAGERLTHDPVVHAGVVYFSTYAPDTDVCDSGTGRLYALDYRSCDAGMDTNGDGKLTASDAVSIEEEGYLSNIAIGGTGKIYYANASTTAVTALSNAADPFMGTAAVSWMEMY